MCNRATIIYAPFFQAIKGKYSTSKQMKIATISQLKSSVVKDFAKQVIQWDDWMFLAPCADLYSCNLNFLNVTEWSARDGTMPVVCMF